MFSVDLSKDIQHIII